LNRKSWLAAALLVSASTAGASAWKAVGAANGHGETLSLAMDDGHSYSFECAPDAVLISETGVTGLLDIRGGGGKVGDAPGSTMPEGAAVMALYGLPETYFEQFVPRINAVTSADVVDAAARYLDPAKLTTLVVGDYSAIADSLRSLDLGEPQLQTAEF